MYSKEYDADSDHFYYVNKRSKEEQDTRPLLLFAHTDIPLSSTSKALVSQRSKRQVELEVLEQAKEEHKEEQRVYRESKEVEAAEKAKQLLISQWQGPITHSKPHGELLANWKNLSAFPHTFYLIAPTLTVLNLVGNSFETLPEAFCPALPNLRTMALSNCGLRSLPENISCLKALTELNVMKNELVRLPDGIGQLAKLSLLHITNNRLSDLPETFVNLSALKRVVLEANPIRHLPSDFGEMRCTLFSASRTGLAGFPSSFSQLNLLTSVTVDNADIEEIPARFGNLSSLRHCSFCNNRIRAIPLELAECTELRSLWLDWNDIEEVQEQIVRIKSLEDLRMEGNPLRLPTIEIIGDGVDAARKWFSDQGEFVIRRERKKIIVRLQQLLREVASDDVVSAAWLRSNVSSETVGDEADRFFAFPPGALFTTIIPAWNKLHPSDPFLFSEAETTDAMANLTDAYGTISTAAAASDPSEDPTTTESVMFGKCECLHSDRSRVCVPPNEHFMCERPAELLKETLVTNTVFAARESHKAELRAVEAAHEEAAIKAAEYINSEKGQEHLNLGALRRATKQLEDEERARFSSKGKLRLEQIKQKEDLSREKRRAQLERKLARKIEALTEKRNEILAKKERLAGWELENCEDDLEDIEDDLANLQEEEMLKELAKEQQDAEERFEDEVEQLYNVQHGKSQKTRIWPLSAMAEAKRRNDLKLRQQLCKQELILEYIDACQQDAESRVHYEFKISRRIMHNWLNLLIRSTFHSWVDFTEVSVKWKRRKARLEAEIALVEQENERVTEQYIKMERAKWERKIDPYSDQPYWQHAETQEVVWEEPVVTEYIPRH